MSEKETEKVEQEINEKENKPEMTEKVKTAEELQEEINALSRSLANKTEEAQRVHKKLEDYEKAEENKRKAEMTEMEKLQDKIGETETALKQKTDELEQMKLNEVKRGIAEEVGLPTPFALRIQGETPEDMKADAQALLDAMPKVKATIPSTIPGANAQHLKETDVERRQRLGLSR